MSAGPVLRAGFTEVLVTGILIRWISVSTMPNRTFLPPEIAFIRERYPESYWRAHDNFGELAAFWLQVHDSLHADGRTLQGATCDFREGFWDSVADFQHGFMPQLGRHLQQWRLSFDGPVFRDSGLPELVSSR